MIFYYDIKIQYRLAKVKNGERVERERMSKLVGGAAFRQSLLGILEEIATSRF